MTRRARLLARVRLWLRLAPLLFAVSCAVPVSAPPAAVTVPPAAEPTFVDAPIDARAVVVIVSGFQRICTGVAVSPVHIYTAAHCVRQNMGFVRADAWLAKGGVAPPSAVVPLELVSSDAGLDRALFTLAAGAAALPAWLEIMPARRDDWVWAVVYREAPARLERLLDTSGEPGYFAAAPVDHGDSGAPVIAENGTLVGIVTNCRGPVELVDVCTGGGTWRPFGIEYPEE